MYKKILVTVISLIAFSAVFAVAQSGIILGNDITTEEFLAKPIEPVALIPAISNVVADSQNISWDFKLDSFVMNAVDANAWQIADGFTEAEKMFSDSMTTDGIRQCIRENVDNATCIERGKAQILLNIWWKREAENAELASLKAMALDDEKRLESVLSGIIFEFTQEDLEKTKEELLEIINPEPEPEPEPN